MKNAILILMVNAITIAVALPLLTNESTGQNENSYIPGVFILTSVKKLQGQLKNGKHNQVETAKVKTEKDQRDKLSVYRQNGNLNDPIKPRVTMLNQAPVLLSQETHQNLAKLPTLPNTELSQNKLYLSHRPSEKALDTNQSTFSSQIMYSQQLPQQYIQIIPSSNQQSQNQQTNQQISNQPLVLYQMPNNQNLPNQLSNQQYILVQPLNNQLNQPVMLQQQYMPNQNPYPTSSIVLANQQPLQVMPTQIQTVTNSGLSNYPIILVEQPTQSGQSIVLTSQPNPAVLVQPNQMQNGQLRQASTVLMATNGNQTALLQKPAQNQAVYTIVTLGQNSIPSENGNTYLISVPSAG